MITFIICLEKTTLCQVSKVNSELTRKLQARRTNQRWRTIEKVSVRTLRYLVIWLMTLSNVYDRLLIRQTIRNCSIWQCMLLGDIFDQTADFA